jgi:subtilase family serine protease
MEDISVGMGFRLGNRHDVLWLCAAMAFGLFAQPAQAQQRRTLSGHVPATTTQLQPVDRLPGSARLNLAIGLPLRNQEGLATLLQQIYDPSSPQYRHYLTPEQFTEKFGPTEQDYQAVVDFANRNGFRITATHPNRLPLDVDASVADEVGGVNRDG